MEEGETNKEIGLEWIDLVGIRQKKSDQCLTENELLVNLTDVMMAEHGSLGI